MKLWEIKANALRLMFADTDINFSESEFSSGTIYQNSNTREKLVGMNASIGRAIDLFYLYNGVPTSFTTKVLDSHEDEEGETVYEAQIDMSDVLNFSFPTRVDMIDVDEDILLYNKKNIGFLFDSVNKKIFFEDKSVRLIGDKIQFFIYYKREYNDSFSNLMATDVDDLTFDLNSFGIEENVQRMIPYFIKGEFFEEDEPNLAAAAKNEYITFLMLNQRSKFSKNQTKVTNKFPRSE
jgi:hypothetical protein